MSSVKRIFVEKKIGCDIEAQLLLSDLRENLLIYELKGLRILNRYDCSGIFQSSFELVKNTIFSDPTVDNVFDENIIIHDDEYIFAVEYLPGQYDQRADSAVQCVQIVTDGVTPVIKCAKVYILKGKLSDEDISNIKKYCINTVDSKEASLEKPDNITMMFDVPKDIEILTGFIEMHDDEIFNLYNELGFAMSSNDLLFCRDYFKEKEQRDPSVTELRVIDTYWSDHCRHTTFLTTLNNIIIEESNYTKPIKDALDCFVNTYSDIYGVTNKDMCLMDIAVLGMKSLKSQGLLNDIDESDEINACSIKIDVNVDGNIEKWLLMFKNETHNHPTEIEPFGGAATCLGGAIRDPLSGRSYVYQAMRVTGSSNPNRKVAETLPGKLPASKITTGAAHGYSSYGNQIGLATGMVHEFYNEGYMAKRMEIGAVIGAAPYNNVYRDTPLASDVVILVGGRTGRDGCGGATGSSKEHDEKSILNCGAEVQKGNPPTERKLQRLFRNAEASKLIIRCNDFGAGGVAVAIGELADGLFIDLDLILKKYEGLDGTELAISESQERMAVVVHKDNVDKFIKLSADENLEATVVAYVTDDRRLTMRWRGNTIVDISRNFLDTNGVKQSADVFIKAPENIMPHYDSNNNFAEQLLSNLSKLNVASQKGLIERFDSTIGAGTVLMPFGGKYQLTQPTAMVAKIPVLHGDTSTVSLMSFGFSPDISSLSPFHGAVIAIMDSIAKIVACGGAYDKVRLSLQEYFEKLGDDPVKWGKPTAALLGAFYAQMMLGVPAIGGKDSMSGSFKELSVPETLVSFAVCTGDIENIISPEFKKVNSVVVLIRCPYDEYGVVSFNAQIKNFKLVTSLIREKKALSVQTTGYGGIGCAVAKMCFGNKIGFRYNTIASATALFGMEYGSFILEFEKNEFNISLFGNIPFTMLGETIEQDEIIFNNEIVKLDTALTSWLSTLEKVFPTKTENTLKGIPYIETCIKQDIPKSKNKIASPRVFIPVFPGTNCEYDSERAFVNAGGTVDSFVFKNYSQDSILDSVDHIVNKINNSQIIMLSGGFSAGDEPDGSGKFIASVFRNPYIKESIHNLLYKRDGLILGICNGFQALLKLGLLPFGKIGTIDELSPTLTFNSIGRHMSQMVNTKIISNLSPWLSNVSVADIHTIPISHGEGRFLAPKELVSQLEKNGQVATQYVDFNGVPSYDIEHNPNGSFFAIEGITNADGRIFGKMGHSERIGYGLYKNIEGNFDQKIFLSGIEYFS